VTNPGRVGARSRSLDDATLGEFLGVIYAATTKPDEWQTFFAKVSQRFGGHAAIYERAASNPEGHQLTATNLDPEFCRLYNLRYNATNVWATSPLNQSSAIVRCEQIIEPRLLERTEFYGDWLRPQKLKYAMTCQVRACATRSFNLGLVREERLGSYGDHELKFLACLLPHLRRAAEISSRLEGAEITARSSLAALEQVGVAAMLVRQDSSIWYANSAAEEMFRSDAAIRSSSGRIMAEASHLPGLHSAIRDATRPVSAVGTILTPKYVDQEGAFSLAITPFENAGGGPFNKERLALAIVSHPARRNGLSSAAMRSRFGFTAAEAQLAAALCAGSTLNEHAEERGVSHVTVKSHLAALFTKVGVNRQIDLVRILLQDSLLSSAAVSLSASNEEQKRMN
jgi:DNA-binding CsgD family transcriptional regulator